MKKHFILSILLAVGMTVAAQTPWNGTVADAYAGGDGTPENPYQIATAEQLALLAFETNEGDGGNPNCYVLTEDINLNGTKGYLWTPIGTVKTEWHPTNPNIQPSNPFMGVFEGNNHVISEMYVNDRDVLGLFGCTENAVVRNIQITESDLTLGDYVGMVVGLSVNSNIVNCIVSGSIQAYGNKVGGIAGHFVADGIGNDTVFIIDCISRAAIMDCDMYLGGIAGYTTMDNGNLVIEHCVNQGDIGGLTNTFSAGGMVGQGSFIIRNCHNYGKVSSETTAGGMVGQGGSFGLIECCINHASGEVVGGSSAGGIIGTPIFTTIKKSGNRALVTGKGNSLILVGGIAGSDGSISNCYNIGDLKGIATSNDVIVEMGGITGSPTDGFVYNVYNSGQIIKPTNPNLLSEIYGHVIPAILSDTAIRNCYWYGNEEIPTYVYNIDNQSYVYLPGSCVFNDGATSTSWTLNEAQYGTTDLLEALNLGAMGECVWVEDEEDVNRGFPVIGLKDPNAIKETAENKYNVYPNPTNDVLFVETCHGASLLVTTEYRITNLMGQTLQSGRIAGDRQQLDVSALPAGMYLLAIDNATVKFVVK